MVAVTVARPTRGRKSPSPPEDPDSHNAAYVLALRWLSARELSEGQVRERLARRGYTAWAVDAAIRRLIQQRAVDERGPGVVLRSQCE